MVSALSFHCRPNNQYTVCFNDEISVHEILLHIYFSVCLFFFLLCNTDHGFFSPNLSEQILKNVFQWFLLKQKS